MVKSTTELPAAGVFTGNELIEVSQASATVRVSGVTVSAAAADNSFNDSANGFIAAGFAVGDRVGVKGFTAGANNLLMGVITTLTAAKMIIGGVEGDAIVNEAAGNLVTIAKWKSVRATTTALAALVPAGIGEAPSDGTTYGRMNGAWADVTEEAPLDSGYYVRRNGLWVPAPASGIPDAPSDGSEYVRKNGAWAVSSGGGGGGGGSGPSHPGLQAHRYWLVHFEQSKNNAVTLSEVEFRATPGGADQCSGGTAFAHATNVGAAANAFDNSTATFWGDTTGVGATSSAVDAFIGYDFGAGNTKVVQEVSITPRADAAPDQTPLYGTLMYSDDGVKYYPAFDWKFTTPWVLGTARTAKNPLLDGGAGGGGTPTESIIIAVSDETTAITAGTAKVTFRMPYAFTLTEVRASLTTASSSGLPTIDINEGGVSILSTKLTIDVGEKTSVTAATPPVISDASVADDAEMTIDIDVAGTGAAGLKVYLIGHR